MNPNATVLDFFNETEDNQYEDDEGPPRFVPEVDTFPVVLAVLIVVANGLALFLFAKNRRLRNITNTFLMSLAISDLIAGLLGIPFYLICSAVDRDRFCTVTMLFWRFTTTSTVLHLLTVTLDRYVAIVHAIRYHSIVTRAKATFIIVLVWITSAFVAVIQLAWQTGPDDEEQEGEEGEDEQVEPQALSTNAIYQVVTLILFFALPLLAMVFSYVRIFKIVRYHEQQIKRHNMPSNNMQPEQKRHSVFNIQAQWRTAIVYLVMTMVYVICWLPYFLKELRELFDMFNISHLAEYVLIFYPRFVTSLTNPLFYIIGKQDFRKALFRNKKHNENGTQMSSLMGNRDSGRQ